MQSKENTVPLASLPLEPISLRDYFAGQALANLATRAGHGPSIADVCYQYADAMLAARTGDA